jgi:hypothetical protein
MNTTMRVALSLLILLSLTSPAAAQRRRVIHHPEPQFNIAYTEGGYADRISVAQGQPITFHIASAITPLRVDIVNLAEPDVVVRSISNVATHQQNCSGRAAQGCDWTPSTTLDIPFAWPSGFYAARFPTSFGTRHIFFAVRENHPGTTSRTLVVAATHTYVAYNAFGGRSLYPSNDPNRANELSFNRPFDDGAGLGRFDEWEQHFVQWMRSENRSYEAATDSDLEDPTLLNRYDLVIFVGHSEYWTTTARNNLESYNRSGGHIAVFGGNSMWWQVRLQAQGRTLIGFKSGAYDPIIETQPGLATTNWYADPVNRPENLILGSSFRHGGYVNRASQTPGDYTVVPVEQRQRYTVTEPSHWIFNGAPVALGTEFGQTTSGLEVDGVIFTCDNAGRIASVEGSDGTPRNFHVLAITPASDGWGTIGIYTNSVGAAVFNAGTQNWVYGLKADPVVIRMTQNVLDRLATGNPLPYDPSLTEPLIDERFNCPQNPHLAVPGWRGGRTTRGQVTAACAYEGPGGLELSGENLIELTRNFAPTGAGVDHAEMRAYVNVDEYQKRTQFPLPLFVLQSRTGTRVQQAVLVEFDVIEGKRMVRIGRRDPNTKVFSASSWIPLDAGFHLIELSWRSPGTISLKVDGGTAVTLNNPTAGQLVEELVVDWLQSEIANTGGRICVDGIAAGLEAPGSLPALR